MFIREQQYALADQIRRASKSICANLAEGFAKSHTSPAEFKRFTLIAIGSAEEIIVWISFAKDLGYVDEQTSIILTNEYKTVCKQLNGLMANWKS